MGKTLRGRPPTQGYTLQNEQNPILLSQQDIHTIETFIDGEKPLIPAYQTQTTGSITERELQALYSKQAATGQRNNALFNTGLLARDKGWSLKDTIAALADLHTYNQQAGESDIARQREAIATLTSAFSRPPRKLEGIQQLPNTIREKFLDMGQTGTAHRGAPAERARTRNADYLATGMGRTRWDCRTRYNYQCFQYHHRRG